MSRYFVLLIATAVLAQLSESKPAGYQVLESRPGYVPVYIRFGDQPLEEINPSLAAAFRESEHGISARNIRTKLEPKDDLAVSNFGLGFGGALKTFEDAAKTVGETVGKIPEIVKEFASGGDSSAKAPAPKKE